MRLAQKRRVRRAHRQAPAGTVMHLSEAARRLGVSPQALTKAHKAGRLQVHHVGKRVLVSEEENTEFFAEMRALKPIRQARGLLKPAPATE